MSRLSTKAFAALAGVVMIAGCTAGCDSTARDGRPDREEDAMATTAGPTAAQKGGTGELRTDAEPLTDRFPALGAPREVRWMSGTYGDPRVPGPSTYWIDAVVHLDPDQVAAMVDTYAPALSGQTPAVVDGMQEHLPAGPYLTGEALDAAFAEQRWGAAAFLDATAGALVLVAIGS